MGSDTDEDEASTGDDDLDDEDAVAKAKAFAKTIKGSSASATGRGRNGGSGPSGDVLARAMAELDMDKYDDDDDDEGDDKEARRLLGSGNPGMAFHRNPEEDPYLLRSRDGDDSDGEDSMSEADDLRIRGTDLLILAARNDEDISNLELWVYEEPDERGDGNLYVHHSLLLPAFPLSLAWLDVDCTGRKERGNYAAVGSFEPGIEIWDMDVLDAVEPVGVLGGADYEKAKEQQHQLLMAEGEDEDDEDGTTSKSKASKKKKKKKSKKKGTDKIPTIPVKPGSHSDAVLGLSWNRLYRNVLASASADTTVKVWDVSTLECSQTLTYHSDKVQAVSWNLVEGQVLLSGGFDKRVCLGDVRSNGDGNGVAVWEVGSDVEAVAWSPFTPTQFAVCAESGEVGVWDARRGAGSAPLVRFQAHKKAATSVSYSPAVPGLLCTASTDKKVKLWGVSGEGDNAELLASEDLKVGALFGASFSRDVPSLVVVGGAKGEVAVWDTLSQESVVAWAEKHT